MASRTSTILQAKKGALLHTNTSTSAQLISVNAVSNTTTLNPKFSMLVHNANNAQLNFAEKKYSMSWVDRTIDIDIPNKGTTVVQNTQNGFTYLGQGGTPFETTVANTRWSCRFQTYDPWMLQKPSEYGNANDNICGFGHVYTGQANYINNVFDSKANFAQYFAYFGNNADRNIAAGLSYYDRGIVFDQHTGAFFGYNSQNYTSAGMFIVGGGIHSTANRSTDSGIYNAQGGSQDAVTYSSNSYTKPHMVADGGLICVSGWRNASTDFLCMFPFGRGEWGGTLPADKTAFVNTSSGSQHLASPSNFSYSSYSSWIQTASNSFEWMKYNKKTDRYYFCFSTGTADEAGIWEVEWGKFSSSPVAGWGEGGAGPTSQSLSSPNSAQFSNWKKVAEFPVGVIKMTIPAKVGSSLWVSYSVDGSYAGTAPLFSTDLKTWKSASEFIDGSYVFQANTTDSPEKEYLVNSATGEVVEVVSGFANIVQSGLLEKETAVGNYTRNGLIINSGDSVYAENLDAAADISITITEVAI